MLVAISSHVTPLLTRYFAQAKIAGMTEDLEMTSSNYEWLLTAFYMSYIVCTPEHSISFPANEWAKISSV